MMHIAFTYFIFYSVSLPSILETSSLAVESTILKGPSQLLQNLFPIEQILTTKSSCDKGYIILYSSNKKIIINRIRKLTKKIKFLLYKQFVFINVSILPFFYLLSLTTTKESPLLYPEYLASLFFFI